MQKVRMESLCAAVSTMRGITACEGLWGLWKVSLGLTGWRGRIFSASKSPHPLYSTKPTSKHLVCALREDFLNFQSTKTKKLRKMKGFAWSLKMHFVAQKLKRMHRCKCWATGAEYIWLNGSRRRGDHNLQSGDSLLKRTSEHLQCERCVCFSPVLTQQCEWCVCFSPVLTQQCEWCVCFTCKSYRRIIRRDPLISHAFRFSTKWDKFVLQFRPSIF